MFDGAPLLASMRAAAWMASWVLLMSPPSP